MGEFVGWAPPEGILQTKAKVSSNPFVEKDSTKLPDDYRNKSLSAFGRSYAALLRSEGSTSIAIGDGVTLERTQFSHLVIGQETALRHMGLGREVEGMKQIVKIEVGSGPR